MAISEWRIGNDVEESSRSLIQTIDRVADGCAQRHQKHHRKFGVPTMIRSP